MVCDACPFRVGRLLNELVLSIARVPALYRMAIALNLKQRFLFASPFLQLSASCCC